MEVNRWSEGNGESQKVFPSSMPPLPGSIPESSGQQDGSGAISNREEGNLAEGGKKIVFPAFPADISVQGDQEEEKGDKQQKQVGDGREAAANQVTQSTQDVSSGEGSRKEKKHDKKRKRSRSRSNKKDKKRKKSDSENKKKHKKKHKKRKHSDSRRRKHSSSESSRSRDKRPKRNNQKNDKLQNVHPYFQRKNMGQGKVVGEEGGPKPFWDGFQWVIRTQPAFDVVQNATDYAKTAVTGESKAKNEERLAASRTVIIEGFALDLGLTEKELQKFILEALRQNGEENVEIVDIDLTYGPTSISVELQSKEMVDAVKKLNGMKVLGETLKVRRVNEETTESNAQAAAIALAAFKQLTGGTAASEPKPVDPNEIPTESKVGTLKTVNISTVIKISNMHDREEELTKDLYEGLFEDIEEQFMKVPHLKNIWIVRNGEEKLGAEVGAVFVEFRDKRSAEMGLKLIKGRIYDGREIKVCYVDEALYYHSIVGEKS